MLLVDFCFFIVSIEFSMFFIANAFSLTLYGSISKFIIISFKQSYSPLACADITFISPFLLVLQLYSSFNSSIHGKSSKIPSIANIK
jgi:hypothetical protein